MTHALSLYNNWEVSRSRRREFRVPRSIVVANTHTSLLPRHTLRWVHSTWEFIGTWVVSALESPPLGTRVCGYGDVVSPGCSRCTLASLCRHVGGSSATEIDAAVEQRWSSVQRDVDAKDIEVAPLKDEREKHKQIYKQSEKEAGLKFSFKFLNNSL